MSVFKTDQRPLTGTFLDARSWWNSRVVRLVASVRSKVGAPTKNQTLLPALGKLDPGFTGRGMRSYLVEVARIELAS